MTHEENEPMPVRPAEVQALPPVRMTAEQKVALWSRVEASAAVAATHSGGDPQGPAASSAGTTPSPSIAGLGSSAVKWSLALLAGIAVGAGVDRYGFPPEPTVIEKVVVRTEQVRVEVPVAIPAVEPRSAPPMKTALRRPESKAPTPVPVAPEVVASGTNVERQLIEGARTALVRRDASSALQTLAKLRQDFPGGQLIEERDSLEVQALQQAGREDDAKASAKVFLDRYPRSVFGPSMEAVLRDEK